MSPRDVAHLLQLPAAERFELAELLWQSLPSTPTAVPLGEAHRQVLDERLAEHERDPYDIVSLAEVLAIARQGG